MHFVTFLTTLGRYYDNTTCTLCTVDTGRTGVFQYGNGLYIVRVERTAHHTIYYVDRSGTGVDRTCTTNTDLSRITRLTTGVRYRQTGYFTL